VNDHSVEGPSAAVDLAGRPDADPIVLLHGTVFNRTMWAPLRETLSDSFRVVAPDLPGHGERRDEPFDLETAVETVDAAVEAHADGSAHVVGLSLGGYVATAFAGRHPGSVEGLVLSGSSANPVGRLGTLSDLVGRAALLASRSDRVERGVDRLAARWVRDRDLSPAAETEIVDAGFDLRPFGEAGGEIAGEDFRAALAAYGGPALVLNGQWDFLMRRGETAHADAAGDARVAVVDGAGHACNLERPETYAAAVRRFVTATSD
jgi:pimeloyl-ACP methyl ester carboxylesterase